MKGPTAKLEEDRVGQPIRLAPLSDFLTPLAAPKPQPSLRVPVTRENRLLLRTMRAVEQAAWESGINIQAQGQH